MYGVVVVVSRKTGQTSQCVCPKLQWSKFENMNVSGMCKKNIGLLKVNEKVNENGLGGGKS